MIEWLCHTNYSFLVGSSSPEDYVERAIELGYSGLGICDFDGLYGIIQSWRAREKFHSPLKLFYGAEIHFTKDHAQPIVEQLTLALFAPNHQAYFQLCQLITYMHRNGKKDPEVSFDDFLNMDLSEVIAIQPMRGAVRTQTPEKFEQHIQKLQYKFQSPAKNNFFMAISSHLQPAEDMWIDPTLAVAKKLNIPLLLSQDPFFHASAQKDLNDITHSIRLNEPVHAISQHLFANGERSLNSFKTIQHRLKKTPWFTSAYENALKLAERFHFDLKELRYQYPKEMIPQGFDAQSFLEYLVWENANKIYNTVPDKVKNLLNHELKLVKHLKFPDYFLTVWDIVRWARSQNILCQGRGSAANSAICFVLGITSLDPSTFEVLFERFISVERGDPPDIDVDFEHERREEVIQYIYERYGRSRAAMVANVVTFRKRGAMRAVGKALSIPEKILSRASEILDSRYHRGQSIAEIVTELKTELPQCEISENIMTQWIRLASRLKGFPRHLSIHSGGFVLSERTLNWLSPQEPATMPGRSVIQWCKDDIEAIGFFKIDMLSLGMLTAVRKTFSLIQEHHQQSLTFNTVPELDAPTYKMIQRADTVGTFQIESRAQMSMLPRLKPKTFYDLVIEVAIIRPGPIQGGMIHPYLRRRDGLEAINYADPRLEPILKRTLGIPIFQEQVMRIAIAVGNFTPGEANELRRHMGSFSMKGNISPWLTKLKEGMRANKISEEFIEGICGQMKGFSDYGFPESHAASFAFIAYVSSYLKCHYPDCFFVALLNSQPMGFYSPHVILQTAKHAGIQIKPPCINQSRWDLTLEKGSTKYHDIRIGMRLIGKLSKRCAERIEAERPQNGWTSFENFLKDIQPSRTDVTALAAANAFSCFGYERRDALWLSVAVPIHTTLDCAAEETLFPRENLFESTQHDFQSVGTTLSYHPVEILYNNSWVYSVPRERITKAKEIQTDQTTTQKWLFVFGMVTVRQAPPSAKGMVFLTMEDETGSMNIALQPQVYNQFHKIIDHQSFLCLYGKLQKNGDARSILVRDVLQPKVNMAKVTKIPELAPESIPPQPEMDIAIARNYF